MWPGPRGSCPDGDSRDAVTTGELSTGSARLWRNRTGLGSLGVSSITSEGSVMPLRRLLAVGTAGLLCVGLGACDPASDQAGKPSATATTTTSPAAAPPSATTTAPVPRTTATSPPASSTAPTSSAPASSSSAPAVAAPDPKKYPAMNQQTELGAQQAYEYFWAESLYAYHTGNTTTLARLGMPTCQYCKKAVDAINARAAKGGGWTAAPIKDVVQKKQRTADGVTYIVMSFNVPAHKEQEARDLEVTNWREKRYDTAARMKWDGSGWRVDEVDIDAVHTV